VPIRVFYFIYPPPPAPPPTLLLVLFPGHECKFSAPFDKNGAGYYIGTNGNTEDFENPHTTGKVLAAMSSILSGGPSCLVEHPHDGSTRNLTKDVANSSVSLDLGKGRALVPNYYCARHGMSSGYGRLRSWDFEGSNDGSNYTVLRSEIPPKR